jgi:hypothetical protein
MQTRNREVLPQQCKNLAQRKNCVEGILLQFAKVRARHSQFAAMGLK